MRIGNAAKIVRWLEIFAGARRTWKGGAVTIASPAPLAWTQVGRKSEK